jgi:hypothetical protein
VSSCYRHLQAEGPIDQNPARRASALDPSNADYADTKTKKAIPNPGDLLPGQVSYTSRGRL